MKFIPLSPTEPIHQYRRNLPHWRAAGATYFVTFRTADSLPRSRLEQLEQQRRLWIQLHPPPWTPAQYAEYHRYGFQKLDRWLDSGWGDCPLKDTTAARVVEEALRFFDGERYALDCFVTMPNHVHALVLPFEPWPVERILQSWKSYTAHKINKILGRAGYFWLEENYDRIVRTLDELERIRAYISENPIRANLSRNTYLVGCGSGIEV